MAVSDRPLIGVPRGHGRWSQCFLSFRSCDTSSSPSAHSLPVDEAPVLGSVSSVTPSPHRSMGSSSYQSFGENVSFEQNYLLGRALPKTAAGTAESVCVDDHQTRLDKQRAWQIDEEPIEQPAEQPAEQPVNQADDTPASGFGAKILGFLSDAFLDLEAEQAYSGSRLVRRSTRGGAARADLFLIDGSRSPSAVQPRSSTRCECTTARSCKACRLRCGSGRRRAVSFAQHVDIIAVPTRAHAQARCARSDMQAAPGNAWRRPR